MNFNKIIWKDRSGISTILVIAVVVILVVAAAAAYIVLSNGNNDDSDKEELAPGTVMSYDVFEGGKLTATQDQIIIGQNKNDYFVEVITTPDGGSASFTQYALAPKAQPKDPKKIGTANDMDTCDGPMDLEIWEYTQEGVKVRAYIDPSSGVAYKEEAVDTDAAVVLTGYDFKWQTSYKESKSIGKTYEYVLSGTNLVAKIKCVADCVDGKFGVKYDFNQFGGGEICFLSDNIQGLPVDATDTEETMTLAGTIDGDVTVQIWEYTEIGAGFVFYYDPVTYIIYQFDLFSGGTTISFDLTKKA